MWQTRYNQIHVMTHATPDKSLKLAQLYQKSMRENFSLPCLSDYSTGETITYGDFAQRIEQLHILYEKIGVHPGDKIALLGKNNIMWVTVFMATITYGAAIVPILSEFNPRDAAHIVNHSDSVFLFVSDNIWEQLHHADFPYVRGVISLDSVTALYQRSGTKLDKTIESLPKKLAKKYPKGFSANDINYKIFPDDHVAIINYTSGTTGFSKGVMLPVRSLWGNVMFGIESKLHYRGSRSLSFLPLAHAYGCAFDMLAPLAVGTHITLLGRTPTPRILMEAMKKIRPQLIICVPLILEKIYKQVILPQLSTPSVRRMLSVPLLDRVVYSRIRKKLVAAFGGEFEEVIVGGAPLNKEVEAFLHRIGFPFTVGYGMTECGPLISYTPWREFVPTSAGHTLRGFMTAKIVSEDADQPGEICVKGTNVMLGYYKRPDDTAATIDEDGWLHTGDMGVLGGDDNQTIFIRGRYKTMILGPGGQNIYPEEIESKLSNMPYVAECLIVERNGGLVALVYPDLDKVDREKLNETDVRKIMDQNRANLNKLVAPYERVNAIELIGNEFEKTPKRSIKRFLYK